MGQRFCLFTIGLLFCIFTKPVEAQLQPIFPAEGSTVTFAQLVSQGFSGMAQVKPRSIEWSSIMDSRISHWDLISHPLPLSHWKTVSNVFMSRKLCLAGNHYGGKEGVDPSDWSCQQSDKLSDSRRFLYYPHQLVSAEPVSHAGSRAAKISVFFRVTSSRQDRWESYCRVDPPATPEDAPFTYDINILPGSTIDSKNVV